MTESSSADAVAAAEVFGVAIHYPEFRRSPRDRRHVRVCAGVGCALAGGRGRTRDVVVGEVGSKKPLTVEELDCFFECSMAMASLVEVRRALETFPDAFRNGG